MTPDIPALGLELRERHGCHAAILYGSHARGDANAQSDYDVAGFGAVTAVVRDAGTWRGAYLDLFIYPLQRLESPDAEMLKLRGGVVMFERDGEATRLLAQVESLFRAGPPRLPPDELAARRQWSRKMLARIGRGDAEGDYRRAWLLTALLEDYFQLRHMWFAGPKESLRWLEENDPPAHAAFAAALRPGADAWHLEQLVDTVVGGGSDMPWKSFRSDAGRS